MKKYLTKEVLKYLLIGAVAFFLFTLVMNRLNTLSSENKQYAQNLAALRDSVRNSNESGREVYSKLSMEFGSIKELKNTIPELYEEIKGLKNSKSITNITKITNVYSDSTKRNIPTTVHQVDEDTYVLKWKYASADSSRVLEGETTIDIGKKIIKQQFGVDSVVYYGETIVEILPIKTDVTTDILKLRLTVGTRKNGKFDEIFVLTNNPNITVTDIVGAQVKRKEKRFGLGPYLGVGLGYNPITGQVNPNAQIGVGVSYRIFKF
jgi:hypothetical protein